MSDHLESLLTAVSPDAPSGVDLEYDPEFARMEKAAKGVPEQEMGSTRTEAVPPDWALVLDLTRKLLSRTHDLRIATYMAQAELFVHGLLGFRDALTVIATYVDKFWDTAFPQLDPDDDNDPAIRINALMGLCNAGLVLRQLRETPLLNSRSVGRFSWTDCAIARGDLLPTGGLEEPPTQAKIDAALKKCDQAEINTFYQAVGDSQNCLRTIEGGFSDRLGASSVPNLELLSKDLKSISKLLKGWLDQFPAAESPAGSEADEPSTNEPNSMIAVESNAIGHLPRFQLTGAASFGIERREDAIEGLDKIIRWFERFEPSSPLPMLLRRAKRLSTMSFLEILRDISPHGVDQALIIGGNDKAEDSDSNQNS